MSNPPRDGHRRTDGEHARDERPRVHAGRSNAFDLNEVDRPEQQVDYRESVAAHCRAALLPEANTTPKTPANAATA